MMTTTGFLYSFMAGSTQTVTSSLALLGAAGNLLTIQSTLENDAAFIDLQGTSSVNFVNVRDNDASPGNSITLPPNSVKGSNTPGWNLLAAVPALSLTALVLLSVTLWRVGRRALGSQA